MNTFLIVTGVVITLGWLLCTVDWVKDGMKIPRYIHITAISAFVLGALTLCGLTYAEIIPLEATLKFSGLIPVGIYLGWFLIMPPNKTA